jgi:DNA-binding IclR family transcriptional regulator
MNQSKPPAQPNLSLMDGLACLQELAAHRDPIGTRELAELLGLEPTRVNRLLKTLAFLGLAEQDERRKYRPGPAIHVLAASALFGSGLLRSAVPSLESLLSYGHIVAMGVLWRDQICYLYYADPTSPQDIAAHGLGHSETFPAASSGIGLALLAYTSSENVQQLYGAEEPSILAGPDGLTAQLAQVQKDGYALATFPNNPKRKTLAVPVGANPYAAIGLSGPIDDAEVDRMLPALLRTAHEIDNNTRSTSHHDRR